MSAFLNAIKNIDDIFVAPKLKEVFTVSMQKLHDYFEENNLLDVIDLNIFFERYLYKSTYPQYNKIKIKYKSKRRNPNIWKNDAYGYYDTDINVISISEMSEKDMELFKTEERAKEEYVASFIHEFIHFITLYGRITYKRNDRFITTKPLHYIKLKENEFTPSLVNESEEIYEPLTEILTSKIMGNNSGVAYRVLVDFMNILNKTFNIDSDKEFLRRNYMPYIKAIGIKNFHNYQKATSWLMANLPREKELKSLDTVMYFMNKMFSEYYRLISPTISSNKFVDIQANYYNGLPFKTVEDYMNVYKPWIEKGNLTYINYLFEKHEIKPTNENIKKMQGLFLKAILVKDSQIYADNYGADFGVKLKINQRDIVFMVKNKTISAISVNNIEDMGDGNHTIISQSENFVQSEIDLEYQDVNNDKTRVLYFKKEKGSNYIDLIQRYKGVNKSKENIDKNILKIGFENGKLTFKVSAEKVEASKDNTQKFLEKFDLLVLNEIKKIKEIENIQKSVKERSLVVKKQPTQDKANITNFKETQEFISASKNKNNNQREF